MDSATDISKSSDVITTESSSVMFTAIEIEEGGQQTESGRGGNVVHTSSIAERQLDHSRTRAVIPEDDVVVGRKTEKQKLIDLVGHPATAMAQR